MHVDKPELGPLKPLGNGAFSVVYRVPDYRLPDNETELVYKEFARDQPTQARSAHAVVSFRDALSQADREELDHYTVWPRALVEDHGAVAGLLMPLIPVEFYCAREDSATGLVGPHLREMQWLIASKQQRDLARIDLPEIGRADRLTLLAQLAYLLARLHEHGWVFGDLSFTNVVFALTPLRIMVLDCDGAAALTDLDRRQATTPMWTPPELRFPSASPRSGAESRRQDTLTDVYKLGLAILRCLSPGRGAASSTSADRIGGLLDADGYNLIARAVSADRSSRPTARELFAYLRTVVPEPQRASLPQVDALRAAGRPLAGVRSDVPSAEDLLSTASDADTLAELIAATETAAPLAVALIGDWGSGKSSVMLQIQRGIDALAELSHSDPSRSMFAANVSQVRFNAWDYSDDHVWVGIADHLFRALAAQTGVPPGPADPEAVRAERARLRSLLDDCEQEERRLAEERQVADEVAIAGGYLAVLSSPVRAARITRAAFAALRQDRRAIAMVMAGWAVLGVVAAVVWWRSGPLIGVTASALAALLSPVVAMARRLHDWYRAATQFGDAQRTGLDAEHHRVRQEIAEVKQRLAVADATARLSMFLADRAGDGGYGQYRGLLGQVRADLAQFAADLADARRQWVADGSVGQPPLQRLVLYIDDLDRCPPRKVVEVLEAINLMLALDLFVVVVAVDPRWVIRSLEYHHRELFGQRPRPTGDSLDEDMATPADYLDKIFQIPFALNAPSPQALASYIRSLLPAPTEPDLPRSRKYSEPADGGSGDGAASSEQARPSVRVAPDDSGRSASPPTPTPTPTRPPSSVQPDLRPLGLQVKPHEVEFMTRLSPILLTPRAAKKLTNLYRLIRIGIPETQLADFTGTELGGPFQVVQILIALLVSYPDMAHQLFERIVEAPDDADIVDALHAIADRPGMFARCALLARQAEALVEQSAALRDTREYQRWCPAIARYSFHARPFRAEEAVARRSPMANAFSTLPNGHGGPGGRSESASAPRKLVLPLYLIIDTSAAMEAVLSSVNDFVRDLRRDIANKPAADSIVRMCIISFSDRAGIGTSMGPVGKPFVRLRSSGRDVADYGAAFRLLAQATQGDVARFGGTGRGVLTPRAFFIVASPPVDQDWADVFRETLIPGPAAERFAGDPPVFVPIGMAGAPEIILGQLADLAANMDGPTIGGDADSIRSLILDQVLKALPSHSDYDSDWV